MGFVECHDRRIVETGLTLLATAQAPLTLWDSAFETTTYLINRLPSKVTHNKSPFQLLFNLTPDYKFLKTFGCECWHFLRPYNTRKLDYRSKSCVFIGYSKEHQGYKCLHLTTGKVYTAHHVVFNESSFPFSKYNQERPTPLTTPPPNPIMFSLPSQPIHTSKSHNPLPHLPSPPSPSPPSQSTTNYDSEFSPSSVNPSVLSSQPSSNFPMNRFH